MTEAPTVRGFTERDAHRALVLACAEAGLDSRDARPIRLGENAMFRLTSAPVMVRIAPSVGRLADVRKEVAVASWLGAADFPSARLFPDCPQATVHDGRVVTFWLHVESGGLAPGFADMAAMLQALHSVPKPVDLLLPLFDPLARVEDRLDCASTVADDVLDFLRQRVKDLYAEYNGLNFALPVGHIHGDGHKGNLLRRTDRRVILLDFEAFAWGPREWDLCTGVGIPFMGFRWVPKEEYAQAVDAYGFDITQWPGFHTLRRIHEITMTTWLMHNVDNSPEVRTEFNRRVASLRHDFLPRVWRPF